MEISATAVRELRERTGCGVMDCKRALTEAGGDVEKATALLGARGLALAEKKAERVANQGVVDAYIHAGGRIGSLVEVNCETDFVARTDDFRQLVHDLAMQVAATDPQYVSAEDMPQELQNELRAQYRSEAEDQGIAAARIDQVVEGRFQKHCQEVCLLAQPFIKQPDRSIQQLVIDNVAKMGENIRVRRFCRFELGK